jgi:hypothetical protein
MHVLSAPKLHHLRGDLCGMQTRQALADIRATLRQWRQPREFRIRATAWSADSVAALAGLAAAAVAGPDAGQAAQDEGLPGRSVADVATSIWRLRNRMAGFPDGMRSATRHVEMAWDALAEAGVEIQDHLNDPFDSGLSLTVVAFQPTPGLGREQIIETIRPSVYLNNRRVQRAEVIVGTPDTAADVPAFGAKETRA